MMIKTNNIEMNASKMHRINNNKGITLIALVVTIIILLILMTITVTAGSSQINKTKLNGFYTKLEIAQEAISKIENLNENYINESGETVYLKNLGATPTAEQINLIKSLGYNSDNFSYYTAEQVEKELNILGVELNLLIDFENSIVINPEGIDINGEKYYTLESNKYKVSKNTNKNTGAIDFTYQVEKYSSTSYIIKITPINVGDVINGTLQYKKADVDYWEVASNNEIIIKRIGQYDIKYTDNNQNTVTKRLEISVDTGGNVAAQEIK